MDICSLMYDNSLDKPKNCESAGAHSRKGYPGLEKIVDMLKNRLDGSVKINGNIVTVNEKQFVFRYNAEGAWAFGRLGTNVGENAVIITIVKCKDLKGISEKNQDTDVEKELYMVRVKDDINDDWYRKSWSLNSTDNSKLLPQDVEKTNESIAGKIGEILSSQSM